MAPIVSIIVPIYKAEKYLRRCIDSILAQTCRDWELLLIDDGSPDNSGTICDEYAANDSRIKVFHKLNGGVSSARNLGLDNAKGEWITFVDADDYISENYLDKIDKKYDVIFLESRTVSLNEEITPKDILVESSYFNEEEIKTFLSTNLYRSIARVPWGKLIKREIIGSTRFVIGQRIGEDTVFAFQLYQKLPHIGVRNGAIYYWQEDAVIDHIKYALESAIAIEYVSNIWREYCKLETCDVDFEFFLITCFFSLIKKDTIKNLKDWFYAPIVQDIELRIKTAKRRLPRSYTLCRTNCVLGYLYWRFK